MKRPPEAVLELVQFVPILTFAVPFMTAGAVDLSAAGGGFLRATVLAVVVTVALHRWQHPRNPIHAATDAWLLVGAVAFSVPLEGVAGLYSTWGALSLFAVVALWGALQLATGRGGFLLGSAATPTQLRKLTPVMIALTLAAIGWAWWWLGDIRIGGGLPFIGLNVVRRVLLKRVG